MGDRRKRLVGAVATMVQERGLLADIQTSATLPSTRGRGWRAPGEEQRRSLAVHMELASSVRRAVALRQRLRSTGVRDMVGREAV
jgi:hypothetical protein